MGDRENPDKSRATPGRMTPADLRAMLEQYTYAECVRLWEQGRLHPEDLRQLRLIDRYGLCIGKPKAKAKPRAKSKDDAAAGKGFYRKEYYPARPPAEQPAAHVSFSENWCFYERNLLILFRNAEHYNEALIQWWRFVVRTARRTWVGAEPFEWDSANDPDVIRLQRQASAERLRNGAKEDALHPEDPWATVSYQLDQWFSIFGRDLPQMPAAWMRTRTVDRSAVEPRFIEPGRTIMD